MLKRRSGKKGFLITIAFLLLPFLTVSGQNIVDPLHLEEVAQFGNFTSDNHTAYDRFRLSPDLDHIAVRAGEHIEVWNLNTQSLIATINDPLSVFAWNPEGSQIATITMETELSIWDAFTGDLIRTHDGIDILSHGTRAIEWLHPDTITTGSFATSFTTDPFEYLLWDVTSEDAPRIVDCHPWGSRLWWSPNGEYIATLGDSTLVWICDNQFNRLFAVEGYRTVAWNPDNTEIATVGIFNTLRIWRIADEEAVATSEGGENNILEISWHSNGKRIATGHLNGEVRIWERLTPDHFWFMGTAQIPDLNDLAWAQDQLITTSDTGYIQVWDIRSADD